MPTLAIAGSALAVLAAAVSGAAPTALTFAGAIVGVGFLIFVHELGHFLACRLTGTRVETFSIGFGPRLFGWETVDGVRRMTVGGRKTPASEGAIDVRIAAIPLGGYVKMAGEVGGDGGAGSVSGGPRRPPKPDELPAKSFRARAFIILAGVLMNAISAVVLFAVAYGVGVEEIQPLVGEVTPGGPAWEGGLRVGDRVVSIGGSPVRSFGDVHAEIVYSTAGKPMEVVVEREGARRTLTVTPRYDEEAGLPMADVEASASWTIPTAVEGGAGAATSFTIGAAERVVVDGRPVVGGRRANLLVQRAMTLGRTHVVLARPEIPGDPPHDVRLPVPAADAKDAKEWKIGVVQGGSAPVAKVRPGSAAERAGVRPGDAIAAVDGVPLVHVMDLDLKTAAGTVVVERAGTTVDLAVGAADGAATADFLDGIALDAKAPPRLATVGTQFADRISPARAAGLREGDLLLAVGGKPVTTWSEALHAFAGIDGSPLSLRVRGTDGSERDVVVTPRHPADPTPLETFLRLEAPIEKVPAGGLLGAVGLGFRRTWGEIRNVGRTIAGFIGGSMSAKKNLGGPGTIVDIAARSAHQGWGAFLAFLAFISVNLAVLNVLPIPVLDGGALLMLTIEKARRGRPLRDSTVAWMQWAGLALLLLLMYFAISNDVVHFTK